MKTEPRIKFTVDGQSPFVPLPEQGSRVSPLREALESDPTVYILHDLGFSQEDIILALVKEKRELLGRLAELESIAPKRIRTKDGREYVWRCPDELVPCVNQGQENL